MSALTGIVLGFLAVVVAFGFIIFIHEMGHFLTARWVDIRCPQFAIGFGPQLFGFRWRGTNFAVRLFPLGGYVLMNGEEPGQQQEDSWTAAVAHYLGEESFPASKEQLLKRLEAVPASERGEAWVEVHDQVAFARAQTFPTLRMVEGNFHDRTIPARILVISGGVIMNFVATILILWGLAPAVGVGAFFPEWAPVVSKVEPGWPADQAGMRSGDWILKVNGKEISTNLEAFQAIGAHPGESVQLDVRSKEGVQETRSIRPLVAIGNERFRVGDKNETILVSSEDHPERAGQSVASPSLESLLEQVRQPGVKSYSLTFSDDDKPIDFALPEGYEKPRGQIGVLFGVSDIRFENKLTLDVSAVASGSPADKGGVKVGDRLIHLGGYQLVSNSDQSFGSLADPALAAYQRLADKGALEILVERGDKAELLDLGKVDGIDTMAALGITLRPLTAGDKAMAPFVMIGQTITLPLDILNAWLSKRATGKQIVESMQGPVGIMTLIYQLSDNGLLQFLFFIALLNAAIGAFNLLPFPALDGARLVFLVIAGLRGGRQIDPEKEARVHLLGLMVLLGFVVIVTYGDLVRLWGSHVFVM